MRVSKPRSPAPRDGGIITSLAVKRGRPDRIAVRLDGSMAFDLAGAVVERAGLRVGDLLASETQERLLVEDAPYRARDRALALLALRDRSRRELETRLKLAGFSPEVASETGTWLAGLG